MPEETTNETEKTPQEIFYALLTKKKLTAEKTAAQRIEKILDCMVESKLIEQFYPTMPPADLKPIRLNLAIKLYKLAQNA